jgi:hypothetical protein
MGSLTNRREWAASADTWIAFGALLCWVPLLISPGPVLAKEHRSREVTREFQREHPCPSTGGTTGRCPGYIRDHVRPLACGGADAAFNLQWQTVAAAKAKDRWERKRCSR